MVKKLLKKKRKRYTKKYNKRKLKSKRKSKKLKKMKGGGPMDFFNKIKEFVIRPKNKFNDAKKQAENTIQETAEVLKRQANDFSQTFKESAVGFLNGKNDKTKWNNMVVKINKNMVEAVEKYFEALVAESKSEKMCLCCKRPYDEEKPIEYNNTDQETPNKDDTGQETPNKDDTGQEKPNEDDTGEKKPYEDDDTGQEKSIEDNTYKDKSYPNDSFKKYDFSDIQ
jgi:hypothetical protein